MTTSGFAKLQPVLHAVFNFNIFIYFCLFYVLMSFALRAIYNVILFIQSDFSCVLLSFSCFVIYCIESCMFSFMRLCFFCLCVCFVLLSLLCVLRVQNVANLSSCRLVNLNFKVGIKIVFVEEASEVLEGHLLACIGQVCIHLFDFDNKNNNGNSNDNNPHKYRLCSK